MRCTLENSPFKNPKLKGDEFDMLYYWESWFECLKEELEEKLKIFSEGPLRKRNYDKGRSDEIKDILGVE